MAYVNLKEREISLKLVYSGPPRSGKTTNLRWLHSQLDEQGRGRLVTLDTHEDRTLFFDLLPIFFRASGLSFRIKVYTVPGQPMHEGTRRVVLNGADGVAFVADSTASEGASNRAAYRNLLENLERMGQEIVDVPIVVQYNKRDVADAISDDELDPMGGHPVIPAVATEGRGVAETFLQLTERTFEAIDRELKMSSRFGLSQDEFMAAVRGFVAGGNPAS